MIYWTEYNTYGAYVGYQNSIDQGNFQFRNWHEVLNQTNIFDQDGTVGFNESIQGSGGTCYLMSSMASMGEYPDLVRNLFLT